MARFSENLSDNITRWFDGLTNRERRLVSIFSLCFCILLIFFLVFLATGKIAKKRLELVQNKEQLTQIKNLQGEYLQAKEKNEEIKEDILNNDVSLFTFIQGISNRLGLSVKDLNETRRPLPKSDIVEISVKVSLTKLSIDKVTALLEAIETSESGELVKVTKLKISKRFDEPDLLDISMTVSTWKSA